MSRSRPTRRHKSARRLAMMPAVLLAIPGVAAAQTEPPSGSVSATVSIAAPAEACITVDLETTLDFGELDFGQSAASPGYGVQSCSEGGQTVYGESTDAANATATVHWGVNDSGTTGVDEFAVDAALDGGDAVWLGLAPSAVGHVAAGETAQAGHTFAAPQPGSGGAGDTMGFEITWTAVVSDPSPPDPGSCDSADFVGEPDGLEAANALGLCTTTTSGTGAGVISASLVRASGAAFPAGTPQTGLLSSFGSVVGPQEGVGLLVLSSGTARTPTDAGYQAEHFGVGAGIAPPGFPKVSDLQCPVPTSIHDDVALELTLRAPANATGFTFSFNYLTRDHPAWLCSQFTDSFVVLMEPAPDGATDGNIAFDQFGNLVSGSSVTHCSGCPNGADDLVGTGFEAHGATGWLQAGAPVSGGQQFTLRFIIWDANDQRSDSTVLLDAFQWVTG